MSNQINGNSPTSANAEVTSESTNGASGFARLADPDNLLSVSEQLSGRRILLTGTTGFLGKVVVSMLLRFHPDVEQLYLLIRSRSDQSSQERFEELIANGQALDPVRETYGAGYRDFLDDKITVVDGDLCRPNLGLNESTALEISKNLDLVINSAGLTNFNPNLRSALEINTLSNEHVLGFIRLGDCNARLLHVSTAFVCGNQSGAIPEIEPDPDVYPRYDELQTPFDHRCEIRDCLKLIEHFEEISLDQEHRIRFAQQAREFLEKNNLDPGDKASFEKASEQARKKWVTRRLSDEGRERAEFWGWPNIYTYTKSMGERILMEAADDIDLAIVRPAIIESSVEYPEVGWNEGINTTAPLCFLVYKGHRFVPSGENVDMDVLPVDWTSGAMLGVAAGLLDDDFEDLDYIYHLGSSDRNPASMSRFIELTSLVSRRLIDRQVGTPGWQKMLLKSTEGIPVSKETFDRQSAPTINRAAGGLKGLLGRLPTKSMGGVGKTIEGIRSGLTSVEKMTHTTEKIVELFMPFIYDNAPTFTAQNMVTIADCLPPGERHRYGFPIESLDWRDYWADVHMPGLAKHAFPTLESKLRESHRETYTYDDLVELFDASTHNFARRVAMQHHDGQLVERYTYAEMKEQAERASQVLAGSGLGRGRTALLVSENRPQWGMTYFGILKTGGIAVPVDADSTVDQLVNVTRTARAQLIVLSERVEERLGEELEQRLQEEKLPAQVLTLSQLFTLALPDEATVEVATNAASPSSKKAVQTSDEIVAELMRAEDEGEPLASLIFTSGTTGDPKGVMLSHQNFTSLLGNLQQTFHIDERDGFLSVLPLHHTFEFACGLLMPLSRGATITYIEELSPEELSQALSSTRITALIGVPALWQLLERRINDGLADASPTTRALINGLTKLNTVLRERLGLNLGRTLFSPVHQAFGGRLEHMISGGAALPETTMETFHGLGFDLYEGYGLTEAAPVLTVNSPSNGLSPGSVGKALPDMEIDIKDPDDQGVGEVIARGPNVMRGYLGRDEETDAALQDGWLHTGDLGKLDDKGNLILVGREKDVIITSGGKNCYPDELEDIYGDCPNVEELSIVGLPDGDGSERIACLVRPDIAVDTDPDIVAELRSEIREWIRVQGSRGPSHHRIQVLRFWDEELPRTATRKVKRGEVIQILQRLLDAEMEAIERGDMENTTSEWLDELLARLADFDIERIHDETHLLDDMGFDSLMFVELASILEARGYHLTPEVLADIATVGRLQRLLDDAGDSAALITTPAKSAIDKVDSVDIPDPVAETLKELLRTGQMAAYDKLFDVNVYGRAHIPHHNPNIIVVANHSSHLDMGLVKYALGDYGRQIRALAAADYFFKNKPRKTYFENLTNLIPVERSGTLESALGEASKALQRGEMLLVFPEGTRSKSGKIQKFRRGLGYLVDTHNVDILPLWINGTYKALPKGQPLPSPTARELSVQIGPLLSASELREQVEGQSPTDRYEGISNAARKAVTDLRDAALGIDEEPDDDETLQPLFESLDGRFAQNQVDGPVSFYFSLGNWDSHKWTIRIDPDACQIQNGKPSGRADCVIKTSPEMFRKIVEERYIPSMDEFMSGDIKTNDPDLLMRFQAAFELQD